MKHNKLKENSLFDFKAGQLNGDFYDKELKFTASALHYTAIADILQTCSVQYINQNLEGFLIAIEDLIDNTTAILSYNKNIDTKDLVEDVKKLRQRFFNLKTLRIDSPQEREIIQEKLRDIRRRLIFYLRPALVATKVTHSADKKLGNALNG